MTTQLQRSILTLSATLALVSAHASAQPGCTSSAGVPQVAVDLIRDGNGDPVVESNDLTRREYAHITSGLRDALGLTVPADPDDDVRPQIRVTVDSGTLPSGLRSTATFTVEAVVTDPALRVEVYDQDPSEAPGDEDSGVYKLFEGALVPSASLTAYAAAPSRSDVDDGGVTTTQHFCEPAENHAPGDPDDVYGLFESVRVATPRDFVLLVPHGGDVEEGTELQVAEIETAFTARGLAPNLWQADAQWDGDLASERFHTTSKAIDPQTFPGLGDLLAAGDFDAGQGIEFQYAASLHGFGPYTGYGFVLGGRASLETKCYVARQIQLDLAGAGESAAFYVWPPDADPAGALDLPDDTGGRITDQRPNVGLTGRNCDNIVNRLTQGPGCAAGLGGVQIEESRDLRDDANVRALVSQAIADAFADMILDPTLVDPAATVHCDALSSAAVGGPGQIGDRVWTDLDGDGVQGAGEPGHEGVTVELLDGGAVVATTTTSTTGRYVFGGLAPATYTVRFTLPAGYTFSPLGPGGADDSDVVSGGETAAIVLAQGETRLDVDAGLEPDGTAGQIGDFVWEDLDGNGAFDPGESGLSGVTVKLESALGTPVAQTVTDAAGQYLFTDLLPGDYVVRFDAPGWVRTAPSTFEPFFLGADAVDLTRDAGFAADCQDFPLVAFGSDWAYLGSSGAWDVTWKEPSFDDSTWTSGPGLLGFSTSRQVHATVPNGASTVTYYFRHAFEVADPTLVQGLALEIERDDGAVVYLNGQEVLRSNLPAGPFDASTRAIDSSWDLDSASVDAGLLLAGTNFLAVEIHQRYIGADADFAFDLELRAESCDPCRVGATELVTVADTYLRENQPTSNKGSLSGLWADGGPGEGRSPLLAFDLSAVPAGVTVLGAEIDFEVLDLTSAFYPVYALERAWVESQATWNHAASGVPWQTPGAAGALDRYDAVLGIARRKELGPYTLSLTAAGRSTVGDWLSGAAVHHGVVIAAGDSTYGFKVGSRESATPPVLRVVHTTTCSP